MRCIGPILTTWRIFSLFKMPSRRPRVMPATFNNLVPLIMALSIGETSQHVHNKRTSKNLADLCEPGENPKESSFLPSRRATQIPLASTWKQSEPSSSHRVAVTRGFMPGGAICPVTSNPLLYPAGAMPGWLTPGSGRTGWGPAIGLDTGGPAGGVRPLG